MPKAEVLVDSSLEVSKGHTRARFERLLRPLLFAGVLLLLWQFLVVRQPNPLLPTPLQAVRGVWELLRSGLLAKYVVASLFRVTWGFLLGAGLAIPLGLLVGWFRRADIAINPIAQILRPISPLAWIPLAKEWHRPSIPKEARAI